MGGTLSVPPYAAAQSAGAIEEITVTARRTEESIQSVPVSVTAFDAGGLREAGISTPEDVQLNTPGVYLSGSGGRQNAVYQIRGQSKALAGPSSPAVVTYYSEVPEPAFGGYLPQYDIASVQVLKGPQGTLFGRNTTGGAVLYSPTEPTHELEGSVSGAFGNYDRQQYQGVLNLPLVADKVALRLAGDIHKRDGYVKNIGVGGDAEAVDTQALRVSLLLEPTAFIKNVTTYEHFDSENDGFSIILGDVRPGYSLLTIYGALASAQEEFARQKARGPFKMNSSIDQFETLERTSVTNRTDIDFGGLELVNIFGYREVDLSFATNTDGMPRLTIDGTGLVPFPAGLQMDFIKANLTQQLQQYSNEVQLRGQALDDRLDWIVGAFWLKNEPNGAQGQSVTFAGVPGVTPPVQASYGFITEESKAVFANVKYDLGSLLEGLALDIGVRYTEDKVESCTGAGITDWSGDVTDSDCESRSSNIINAQNTSASSDELTWSAGLNWQITPDLFTYLVTRHGYRAGGVNGPSFSGRLLPYQSFAPETVTDFEIGVRSDWTLGNVALRLNASAFVGYYDDVQSALTGVVSSGLAACNPSSGNNPPDISADGDCDPNNDPSGGTLIVNVGESRVSGMDLALTIAPTENLTLNLGASYLDLDTRKFDSPTGIETFIGADEIVFNYTATKTFTGGIRYSVPIPDGLADELVVSLDHYWTDELFYSDESAVVPSYHLTNMRIDLNGVNGTGLDISAFARNLTDEEYPSSASASGEIIGITTYVQGPPRMYGAEVRYRF
jgi:iron complex outermembrane receptor protein